MAYNCLLLDADDTLVSFKDCERQALIKVLDKYNIAATDENIALYLIAALNKAFTKFCWGTTSFEESILSKVELMLPVDDNGAIDYAYMESTIGVIKERYTARIKDGLEATIGSFDLTDAEQKALDSFQNWTLCDFKIGRLFDINNNPQLNKENFVFIEPSDEAYPYFTRTVRNNGIQGYVKYYDDAHLVKGNSIAVGMMAMKFFYMSHDYYCGQFTKSLVPKFDGFNEYLGNYFVALLNKYTRKFVGSPVGDFESSLADMPIQLPIVKPNQPDYELMYNYAKAIEKQSLKSIFES